MAMGTTGFALERFQSRKLASTFCCSSCGLVVTEDMLVAHPCDHLFCSHCTQQLLARNANCPKCLVDIVELKMPTRLFVSIYNALKLSCEFVGCNQVVKMAEFMHHILQCDFNPGNTRVCVGGCGLVLTPAERAAHSCVDYLLAKLQQERAKNAAKDHRLAAKQQEIDILKRRVPMQVPTHFTCAGGAGFQRNASLTVYYAPAVIPTRATSPTLPTQSGASAEAPIMSYIPYNISSLLQRKLVLCVKLALEDMQREEGTGWGGATQQQRAAIVARVRSTLADNHEHGWYVGVSVVRPPIPPTTPTLLLKIGDAEERISIAQP